MLEMRLRIACSLPVAALAGVLALLPTTQAQERIDNVDATLVAKVEQRVQAWQPTPEERRLDDIAWARDLRVALQLASDNKRLVFLFTYSGCAEPGTAGVPCFCSLTAAVPSASTPSPSSAAEGALPP